jgi:hypothetical protein
MALTNNAGQTITAKAADGIVQEYRKSINGERIIPPVPRFVAKAMQQQIFICNVGPWGHHQRMGGYGEFFIPPCGRDEKYVVMAPVLTDPMCELYVKNEAEMGRFEEDGFQFARELLGDGRGQNSAYSLRHKGCFATEHEVPLKDELAAARREVEQECLRLVNEAREWFASNDPLLRRAIQPEVHFLAAETINLTDEPWMIARNPQTRLKCPICGTYSDSDVVKCPAPNCEYVFDPERLGQILAEQEDRLEAAKNKRKK